MEREAQLVDPFQEGGWSTGLLECVIIQYLFFFQYAHYHFPSLLGVCGRMLDILQRRGEAVAAVGIDGKGPIIEGNPSLGRTVNVISSHLVNLLERRRLDSQAWDEVEGKKLAQIEGLMRLMNEETTIDSGLFSDYVSQNREFLLAFCEQQQLYSFHVQLTMHVFCFSH